MCAIDTKTRTKRVPAAVAPEPVNTLEIRHLPNGQLSLKTGDTTAVVEPCMCFPWSQPTCYISLRDEKNNELAMITDMCELDNRSREALERALAETSFVFDVERVDFLQAEFEIRNWKVVTSQGPCIFQTELDEWPRVLPNGGLLIKDVAGNLYRIRDPKSLDHKSQKLLCGFVD